MKNELDRKLRKLTKLKWVRGSPKFKYLVLKDKYSPRKLVVIKHENGRASLKIWVDSTPYLVLSKANVKKLARHLMREVR